MNDTENQQQKLHPLKYKNFFSFFQAKIKATPVGMRLLAISKPFRKYIRITRILRHIRKIVIFVETSAFFIIYATIFIILIPLILLVLLLIYLFSLCRYAKYTRIFARKIVDSNFTVYFWDGNEEMLKDFIAFLKAQHQVNEIVLIAYSDSLCTPLLAVKEENEYIYHISMGYFYSLKKNVLDKNDGKINYITQTNDTRQ